MLIDNLAQGNLMQRMTDALSRMLNDPSTRLAMRTLGDPEVAATRERTYRERLLGEDNLQSNDENTTGEVEPEVNSDTTGTGQTDDNQAVEAVQSTSRVLDDSMSENISDVPDITINNCGANVDEDPIVIGDQTQKVTTSVISDEGSKRNDGVGTVNPNTLVSPIDKEQSAVSLESNSIG